MQIKAQCWTCAIQNCHLDNLNFSVPMQLLRQRNEHDLLEAAEEALQDLHREAKHQLRNDDGKTVALPIKLEDGGSAQLTLTAGDIL